MQVQAGYKPWGIDRIQRYPWVLPLLSYESTEKLLLDFEAQVVAPAEAKAREQTGRWLGDRTVRQTVLQP
jgi:hypothetical protein